MAKEKHIDPETASTNVGVVQDDAVFGQISQNGPNYRSMGLLGAAALMAKIQIGLGVLSIPSAFSVLGLVPGVICLCAVGAITTWSNYIVGVFKMKHPSVYGVDDVGYMMFGKIGREFFAAAFLLYYVLAGGAGMLGVSIGLNAISSHGTCTAGFVAIAAFVAFAIASIRTLSKISWIALIGVGSILTSITIVTIAVGVQNRPAAAPPTGPWKSDYLITAKPTFAEAMSAVSTMVFAYAGTPGFFPIVSEMRDPERQYGGALALCQSVVSAAYITVGIVVYYFCGTYVASPALGSAGPLLKKICYGLSLPSLFVTSAIATHLAAKYFFVRILRGSRHLTCNSFVHWASWFTCTGCSAAVAYVLASGIPVFGGLISLIGALCGTLLSFQPMGCMWLYDNWNATPERRKTWRWRFMVLFSSFVILIGTFLTVGGTYGAIVDIINAYRAEGGSKPWTCADNSGSS